MEVDHSEGKWALKGFCLTAMKAMGGNGTRWEAEPLHSGWTDVWETLINICLMAKSEFKLSQRKRDKKGCVWIQALSCLSPAVQSALSSCDDPLVLCQVYLRCVLQIWLRISMCFWLTPSVSAGKLLPAFFLSLHWLSGNTHISQSYTQSLSADKTVQREETEALQYPSCPVGRRGWTAAVRGRASPAVGTGWPTGLMSIRS